MTTLARFALAAVAVLAFTHFAARSSHAQSAGATVEEVMENLRSVPARYGEKALDQEGFVRPAESDLRAKIAGNTLKSEDSYSYYGDDATIAIRELSLGGGLESTGTWTVEQGNLCHSVRAGHSFCIGVFFRDDEMLCWPAMGWAPDEVDFVRRCSLLAGNRTQNPPTEEIAAIAPERALPSPADLRALSVDDVLGELRDVAAGDAVSRLAAFGFVRLPADTLHQRVAGNTLQALESFSFYAKDQTVTLKELALGGGLRAEGRWEIVEANLCHSVREGHQFCNGLFFRDDELLCWPGIGWAPDDVDFLRRCSIATGNLAR